MVVPFIKERKKQRHLIIIFGVIVVITFIILYQGYFKKEKLPSVSVSPYYKAIKIGFEVLESPLLKELQLFKEITPFEDKKGRTNPFLPY